MYELSDETKIEMRDGIFTVNYLKDYIDRLKISGLTVRAIKNIKDIISKIRNQGYRIGEMEIENRNIYTDDVELNPEDRELQTEYIAAVRSINSKLNEIYAIWDIPRIEARATETPLRVTYAPILTSNMIISHMQDNSPRIFDHLRITDQNIQSRRSRRSRRSNRLIYLSRPPVHIFENEYNDEFEFDPVYIEPEPEICSICMGNFNENDRYYQCTNGHKFHAECLDNWFDAGHRRCPLCRTASYNFGTQKYLRRRRKSKKLVRNTRNTRNTRN